jgi:hypothetical protein
MQMHAMWFLLNSVVLIRLPSYHCPDWTKPELPCYETTSMWGYFPVPDPSINLLKLDVTAGSAFYFLSRGIPRDTYKIREAAGGM